jgi:hypothetical protein
MKVLSLEQFKNKQLNNGEEYILIFDLGHPVSLEERQDIVAQVGNETNRFKIIDEWTDRAGRYYLKIKIVKNLIFGITVILVLSTVFVIAAGIALSDALSGVVEVTEAAVPLALFGLLGIIVIVGYKWISKR